MKAVVLIWVHDVRGFKDFLTGKVHGKNNLDLENQNSSPTNEKRGWHPFCFRAPNDFALAADKGRVQTNVSEQKKLEAQKMPINRTDSPPSAARFVRWNASNGTSFQPR